jgi:hypothetical protein
VFHGKYYLSGTLHITKNLTLEGTTATFATHDPASQLAFPMGCDGLRFHTGGGAGRDNGPNGETGQAGFSHIYDFSVVCDDHNDFDIENITGIAAGQQPTTLHLRYYNAGGPTWSGTPSEGTSAAHGVDGTGHAPMIGPAFREFAGNGGAGLHGPIQYPQCAAFSGSQYFDGNASTKLGDLISSSSYAFQFLVEFTAASAPGAIAGEPALFTESSGDLLFITFTSAGVRAAHRDSVGIKITAAVPLAVNKPAIVQVRYDGTNLECSVDGGAIASIAADNVSGTLSSLVPRIGANFNASAGIVGRIAQVLVWAAAPAQVDFVDPDRHADLLTNARIAYGHTCQRGHGIRTSADLRMFNIHVDSFGENGLAVFSDGSSPPEIFGNASGWTVGPGCSFDGNGGHGIHVYGGDSNNGLVSRASAAGNHGWAVYDESLDGGTYVAVHAEGNRGHQEEDHTNRDYAAPVGNSSQFVNCYTEFALNMIMGLGECNSLVAGSLHPNSTGFGLAAGVALNKPLMSVNRSGATGIATTIGCDSKADTQMIAFRFGTLDMAGSPHETFSLLYDPSAETWALQDNGFYRRSLRLTTQAGFCREPTVWCENGVMLGRDDPDATPILLTAETAPRVDQYSGAAKTYQRGDTVLQSQPTAGGALGSVCIASGTQSQLRFATTGDLLAFDTALTLANPTSFAANQYITIAGVTGIRQIVALAGSAATLNTAGDNAANIVDGAVAVKMIGTIPNGSPALVVDDTSRLLIGQYIAIAGVTGKQKIVSLGTPAGLECATAEPYDLDDGFTLDVLIDGGTGTLQTVTFHTGDFVDINAATAIEVAARLDVVLAGSSTAPTSGNTKVTITSDTKGVSSHVQVKGGTANAVLGFSTAVVNGMANPVTIEKPNADATATDAIIEFWPATFSTFGVVDSPSKSYAGNTPLALADRYVTVTVTGMTMTLPPSPVDGQTHSIKSQAGVTTTVDTAGGVLTIDGELTATVVPLQNRTFRHSAATGEWEIR